MYRYLSCVALFLTLLFNASALRSEILCNPSCDIELTFPSGGLITAFEKTVFFFGDGAEVHSLDGSILYSQGQTLTLNKGEVMVFAEKGYLKLGRQGNISYSDLEIDSDGVLSINIRRMATPTNVLLGKSLRAHNTQLAISITSDTLTQPVINGLLGDVGLTLAVAQIGTNADTLILMADSQVLGGGSDCLANDNEQDQGEDNASIGVLGVDTCLTGISLTPSYQPLISSDSDGFVFFNPSNGGKSLAVFHPVTEISLLLGEPVVTTFDEGNGGEADNSDEPVQLAPDETDPKATIEGGGVVGIQIITLLLIYVLCGRKKQLSIFRHRKASLPPQI